LTFSYDRYGNMTCVTNGQTNGPCPNYTFNASTNQITNSGFTYDAAGNLTADGTGTGSHSYQWDGESRLKSIDNGSTATYAYNALGQRVEKLVGSTYTEYAYHAGGEDLGENNRTAWTVRVVPFADRHLAHYNNPSGSEATYFMHSTRIGSTSQGTDYTGAVAQDHLFYPWGQEWQMIGTVQEKRFALLGHRDATETGLDPTRFRMFSSTQGRWLSKDPKSGQLCRPQTLNRYAYVQNNSPNLIDPHGTNGGDRGGLVPDPFWPGDLLNGCTDTWDPTCSVGRGPIFGGGYFTGWWFFACPGTTDCGYYFNQCNKATTTTSIAYYCFGAPIVCEFAGDSAYANCVRLCLQQNDPCLNVADPLFPACTSVLHTRCFAQCSVCLFI